eukprot:CAMPEP_0184328430 /NCGR_PEP_ID=MMETSP1049-20130417/143617_1 /TAXON_ID=77928 /ORGANISM="Proteomonas sulcata, Strain CCMP704" /LENGTH=527 /DNA_ID=CAMNT_0026650739 /DNA_START=1384 /DNA_END=2967 /DNA_ORIENTATION=-
MKLKKLRSSPMEGETTGQTSWRAEFLELLGPKQRATLANPRVPYDSSVEKCYRGRTVLLTGSTGFIGKCVLIKLLRVCKEVGQVILLIRKAPSLTAQERFEHICLSTPFAELRKETPEWRELVQNKVRVIQGDLVKEDWDFSAAQILSLKKEVDIFINCSGRKDLDDDIHSMFKSNVDGPLSLLKFAKECEKNVKFVHLSSTQVASSMACCTEAAETVSNLSDYMNEDPAKVVEVLHSSRVHAGGVKRKVKKMRGSFPNNYCFSMACAEVLLARNKGRVDLSIVRGSSVTAALAEPVPGWIENAAGLSEVIDLAFRGELMGIECPENCHWNLIPVDYVVNAIMAGALPTFCDISSEPVVYHACTKHPPPLKLILDTVRKVQDHSEVLQTTFFRPKIKTTHGKWKMGMEMTSKAVKRGLESLVGARGVKEVSRSMAMTVKSLKTTEEINKQIHHFSHNEWDFQVSNAISLQQSLVPEEQKMFPLDSTQLSWFTYIRQTCLGTSKFLLNSVDITASLEVCLPPEVSAPP